MKFLLIFLFAISVRGADIVADSFSWVDVSNAIDSASSGDTVIVPEGIVHWVGGIEVHKPITIRSANATERTHIFFESFAFKTQSTNATIKLSGFVFTPTNGQSSAAVYVAGIGTNCFWLSSCRWSNTLNWCVFVASALNGINGVGPYGLIDDSEFTYTGACFGSIFVYANEGSLSWQTPEHWGTISNVVIERSQFIAASLNASAPAADSHLGGRGIFRHNTLSNITVGSHGPEGASSSGTNSTREWEYYKNDFYFSTAALPQVSNPRGGTGWVYSNTVTSVGTVEYGSIYNLGVYCGAAGVCDANGCINCASSTNYPAAYPISQQIGRGFNGVAETNTPWRFWENTFPASATGPIACAPGSAFGVDGREWTNQPPSDFRQLAFPHPLVGSTPNVPRPPVVNLRRVTL